MPDGHGETSARSTGLPAIAVVGAGCRYPGGVRDIDGLWRSLSEGRDAISATPADRWGPDFLDPAGSEGTMYSGRGGFLDDIDAFDARFFGISPREAAEIDPQHRLLLTTAWEAMEDSGIPLERWAGTRTGVYTGVLGMDYTLLLAKAKGARGVGPYYASGKEASFGAGRIAYTFGLHGPCMMLNSACSSSLLAVHLGSQSLRAGECDAAIAGGVSLMLVPELSIFMSQIEALSPSGVCRPFDTAADGVVRGEGCGMVVLKRHDDAIRDGDRVLAVLKGSATVHDGRSAGLIAPNAEAQEALLHAALADASLSPEDVDYLETHCTGTSLGDRIEVSALTSVFGAKRPEGRPLLIGSHKANFGHTDSAAGILGLLKAILVARHAAVPPQIHLESPLDLVTGGGIRVATRATPLNADKPRTVGVSAFGLSGTNVHVILQSPPVTDPVIDDSPREPLPVLLVSAPTSGALAEHARDLAESTAAAGPAALPALLHAASSRRTHHDYRLAVAGADGEELTRALRSHGTGEVATGSFTGDVLGGRAPGVVHVFSGQGSQWPGMAIDLYDAQPVVRQTLSECDGLVREYAGWSLLEELRHDRESRLAMTEFAQPALFAVQVALSRLWTSWGVAPVAVVGHSVGEIAASHVAGILDLRDSVRLAVLRGQIMQAATGSGRMAQVELPPEDARAALRAFEGEVVIATVNGPHSVVIAGTASAVQAAVAHLQGTGAKCLQLAVNYAFHSPAVHPLGDELEELLADLSPLPAVIPLLSSVLPDQDAPVADAAYWGRNVRDAVRFWPAVDRWLTRRDAVFVEIGAHPVLARPLRDALAYRGRRGVVVSSLARGRSGQLTLAAGLAALYPTGVPVDWRAVHPSSGPRPALPRVPLREERFWLPGIERGEQGGTGAASPTALTVSGELRLFDAGHRLVAIIGDVPVTSIGSGAQQSCDEPSAPVAASAPTPAAHAGSDSAPDVSGRLVGIVDRIAAEVLGVPGRRLSGTRGFFELGFDSFSIVELTARLGAEFGLELPATAAFDHSSINAMAEFLLGQLGEATAGPGPSATAFAAEEPAPARAAEPIAIVGMGCRLPGAAGLDAYWTLLSNAVDATRAMPAGRWDLAAPGLVASLRGGFLEGVDEFDNGFFRVSAREARSMDPQQRMFLEVAWEALEDAGLTMRGLAGSRTGLFVGLNTVDYGQLLSRDLAKINLYYGTGNTFAGAAGRLSYFLGVRGPSMAVDTACASSLTAVHLACQSLRVGESDIALAGGANALLTPTVSVAMSAGGALAPDGRCKAFDAAADGYGRGEGAGAVVLKTLSRAKSDGDRIYAVIRGSAVNHSGASGGLTVPSVDAQAEVIAAALAAGRVDPATVDYVEAHGTGTQLGDPIELTALDRALGGHRPAGSPLLVGSVKTNIAHLEAAAGIAGLIKAVLSLGHREIPAHLHFAQPSPKVPWDRLRLAVTRTATAWPQTAHPRTAGVSAFGFTGANAHVVLSEAPAAAPRPVRTTGRPYALTVSAASPAALEAARVRVADLLEATPETGLADLAYTLGVRRSHLEHRLVAVGPDTGRLADALRTASATATAMEDTGTRFAAVFGPGLGALPWARLYEQEPAFAAALDAADDALAAAGAGASVRDELLRGSGLIAPASPAATTAAQIALAALWSDLGVRPDALAGVGAGQIAASYVAGSLGLHETMAAALRGGSAEIAGSASPPLFTAAAGTGLGRRLSDYGTKLLLDVALSGAAAEIASAADGLFAVSLKDAADSAGPVRLAAELHSRGCRVSWDALLAGRGAHISGPSYPWQRRRHWIEATQGGLTVDRGCDLQSGPAVVPAGADGDGVWCHPVRRVGTGEGELVGAADFVTLVQAACRELLGEADFVLRDLVIEAAGVPAAALSPGSGAHLALRPAAGGWSVSLVAGRHGARDSGPILRARLARAESRPLAANGAVALGNPTRLASPSAALWQGREVLGIEAISVRDARLIDADGRVAAEVSGLYPPEEPQAAQDVRASLADRLYSVRWQETDLPAAEPAAATGRWLVVPLNRGDHETAAALAAALIEAGTADAHLGAGLADLEHLPDESLTAVALVATSESAGTSVVEAVLTAGQTLAVASNGPRLWLVTRGAQDPDADAALVPDRAAAWGLLRVLAMESARVWGGCVDLGAATGQDTGHEYAAVTAAMLSRDQGAPIEDELVRRGGKWYVPRLVRASAPSVLLPVPRCRADGRYLLVGSAARYGEVIERLVAAGARRWVVVRSAGSPAQDLRDAEKAWARRMAAAGAQLDFVGPAPDLPSLEDEPFAGVVIAPPPLPTRPFAQLDAEQAGAALGFVALAEDVESRVRGFSLDFFHVFGSAAASWGAAGMAAAAAVDGALAALVGARRAAGQVAAITRWMPGADTGELTRRDLLMMESTGLTPLSAVDRAEAADLLLREEARDVAVARVDVRRYTAACREQTDRGFLALPASTGTASGRGGAYSGNVVQDHGLAVAPLSSAFAAELAALSPRIRGEVLLDRVLGHVTDVLGEGPGGEVDPERGFFDLGMDSVMAVALKSRLDDELGVDLPATLTFEFPTSRALAEHLLYSLREPEPEPEPEPKSAPAPDVDLDALSEQELTVRLLAELAVSERLLAGEA